MLAYVSLCSFKFIYVHLAYVHLKASPVQGIKIADRQVILSQLADHTTLFLRDPAQVSLAINVINVFSRAPGLYLNIKKLELFSVKQSPLTSINGIPVKDKVTYLGIIVSKDMESRFVDHFSPIMDIHKMKQNIWLHRDLFLRGRTLISKAEGLSRFSYSAQSLYVDAQTSKTIDQSLLHFLWKNKKQYIRKSVVVNSCERCGLNFISFTTLNYTFKINWIKRYLKNPTALWNFIPNLVFTKLGGLYFLLFV